MTATKYEDVFPSCCDSVLLTGRVLQTILRTCCCLPPTAPASAASTVVINPWQWKHKLSHDNTLHVANSHLDNETKQITKFTELLLYYYVLTQKSTHWNSRASVRQARKVDQACQSIWSVDWQGDRVNVKFEGVSAGVPIIPQIGVLPIQYTTKEYLNASV